MDRCVLFWIIVSAIFIDSVIIPSLRKFDTGFERGVKVVTPCKVDLNISYTVQCV